LFRGVRSLFAPAFVAATIISLVPGLAPAAPHEDATNTSAFVPGVRIDWARGAVELDAKVVLRSGPLELIACSPRTREHESIFVTRAKPAQVYQAMGLAGLVPGSPVRYDENSKTWRAPTGEALRVLFRPAASGDWTAIENCVEDPKTHKSPDAIPWVFAGSRSLPGGQFLADLDGTVICLVDFDSALVTVGAMHTADNASLWLEANSDAIPPIGTPCVIRIQSATPRVLAKLLKTGDLSHMNHPVTPVDLAEMWKKIGDPLAILVVLAADDVSQQVIETVRAKLLALGVKSANLSIRRRPKRTQRGA